jgi:hypothetical protein
VKFQDARCSAGQTKRGEVVVQASPGRARPAWPIARTLPDATRIPHGPVTEVRDGEETPPGPDQGADADPGAGVQVQ